MERASPRLLKLVILGDSGVGKTSCLERFVNRRFSLQYKATIGADFLTKELEIDASGFAPESVAGSTPEDAAGSHSNGGSPQHPEQRQWVCLQIWDTAGQERYQSLGSAFYRGADGCALVFDLSNSDSLTNAASWLEEFLLQAAPPVPSAFPFVLLGNKVDLMRSRGAAYEHIRERALAWCATHHRVPFFETSALENIGIDQAMTALARSALHYHECVHEGTEEASGIRVSPLRANEEATSSIRNTCGC